MRWSVWKFVLASLVCLGLASCGGGGGGGDAPADNTSLQLDRTSVAVNAEVGNPSPTVGVLVTANNPPATSLFVGATGTRVGLQDVSVIPGSASATVQLVFKAPATLGVGSYSDTVTVELCHDQQCTRHVRGSPATVSVTYTVTAATGGGGGGGGGVTPEQGVTPLVVSARSTLAHDVVDAEFSRSLNAVVMVAAWPDNLLIVRDAATGDTRQVRLNKLPKAVSVSPDGRFAAVGHDALVSYFNLSDLTVPARLLNVSAVVGDLVLDGRGVVHVFPAVDQWVDVHSVDVATNTEQRRYGPRAGTRVRLHPNGSSIYGANNGLSPDDIEHYDISAGVGVRLRDSPYHGDYPMCGNLWISEDGATVYTACGRAFRSSMDAALDMRYAGSLTLGNSSTALYGWRILSLSQSAARHELVLVEQPWYECSGIGAGTCVSHLGVYESDFLGRSALYSVPPVTVAGRDYAQQGLFVFHRNDGAKLLISRLAAMPNPASEYLLSIVP